jgi:putative sterol carrier protein
MVGLINSCQEYFDTLDRRFIADKAKGVDATYVYELEGDGGGTWTVKVQDGALSVDKGAHPSPSVTYKMKAADYVRLANGQLNGAKAVLTRKLKVSGSIMLAKKMNDFLPPGEGK